MGEECSFSGEGVKSRGGFFFSSPSSVLIKPLVHLSLGVSRIIFLLPLSKSPFSLFLIGLSSGRKKVIQGENSKGGGERKKENKGEKPSSFFLYTGSLSSSLCLWVLPKRCGVVSFQPKTQPEST